MALSAMKKAVMGVYFRLMSQKIGSAEITTNIRNGLPYALALDMIPVLDSTKYGDQTVITGALADRSVTTPKLADASVTAEKIAPGAIDGSHLADGSVTTIKIRDFVNADDPADAGITTPKIGALQITGGTDAESKIAEKTVQTYNIADGAVGNTQMASGAALANLGANVVTGGATGKIALDSVTGGTAAGQGNIASATIGTYNLRDDSVTAAKIADGAIDAAAKIATGVINNTHLAASFTMINAIYRGTASIASSASSGTATITSAPGVNTAKSFLVFSYHDDSGGASCPVSGYISSATGLTFNREDILIVSSIRWEVIEYK